jgi:hypothetical protein
MNCKEAKENIKIEDFLNNLSIQPARNYGRFLWYKSPLPYRKDHNPSFRVDTKTNRWYDAGTGETGNIIDLVITMNVTGVSNALQILQNPGLIKPSFSSFNKQEKYQPQIEIKRIQPVQNRALIQYLENRKIPLDIAIHYIDEVYYSLKNKQYFALAFKNDKGGYELRNKYFKGGSSPKYITTIPGRSDTVNVFEGFLNFLSALSFFGIKEMENKTIILNTTVNLPYAEQIIKTASKINSFLDNDKAGMTALNTIRELNSNVINQSTKIYPGYNDFNDFICNKPIP